MVGILEMSMHDDMSDLALGKHKRAAVLTSTAVLPELRRQGIGTALLQAAQQWAASHHVEALALFVFRDNYAAIR